MPEEFKGDIFDFAKIGITMAAIQKNFPDLGEGDLKVLRELQRENRFSVAKLLSQKNKLASLDELTGIFNRRSFLENLDREIERFKRKGAPLSIVMMDLDFFKKTNDKFGHLVGNEVLRTVAKVLKQEIRKMDVVARYGGEEFVIILPDTNLEEAKNVAEKLRVLVESVIIASKRECVKTTASFGVSEMWSSESKEEFVDRADQALYLAKNSGRNIVKTQFDLKKSRGEESSKKLILRNFRKLIRRIRQKISLMRDHSSFRR